MPWQRLVADVGGELDPDTGLPAYRDVVITVPRQNGKTQLILSWEVQRALGWGSPQKIIYSAQTGSDAAKKLVEDQLPILEPRKAKLGIRTCLRANGKEGIVWKNGSRLGLLASLEDSGHGKTLHLAVRDELFADIDDRRAQMLGPGMFTVPDAQMLTASTAGTDKSVPLNRLVADGRRAVETGRRDGIAYFEWSADPSDDPDDPATWWSCMPALGRSIDETVIRHARDVLFAGKDGEFRRACLNIPTNSDERLIPAVTWDLVCSPVASPAGKLTFAVDVNEDRSAAAIVACSPDRVLEVVEHRAGLGWLFDPSEPLSVPSLNGKWLSPEWAYDLTGPARSLKQDFDRLAIRQRPLQGQEIVEACGAFYDDVIERRLTVRRHPSLDMAVAGATRSMVGDAWRWTRKTATVDLAPLVAATVARHAAIARVDPAENVW